LVPRLKSSLVVALLLTVSATLILGIFPSKILSMAQAGAATFANIPGGPTSPTAMSASNGR
jgi:hypothetical protein